MTRRVLAYLLVFLSTLVVVSGTLYSLKQSRRDFPDPAGDLPGKTAFYRAHARNYDLVYLGDSRTYCAMHPEILDPLLGARSFNLAHWANWLPTQYAQLPDVLSVLPPGALVVWSIGELNFREAPIYDKYPLGLGRAKRMLDMGYRPDELAENLITFCPATFLYAYRGVFLNHALAFANRPLAKAEAAPAPLSPDAPPPLPGMLRSEVQLSGGRAVARTRYMAGGGYLLEELDPAHFRSRQRASWTPPEQGQTAVAQPQASAGQLFTPSPSRWATFLAMLDLFHAHGARLVVNVLEEARFSYADHQALEQVRAFMNGPVRREVETRGFSFVRVDMDQLPDADYFDSDHMNERGARGYSRLLAPLLRPYLEPAQPVRP